MSSKRSGLASRNIPCIPRLSNWNTATVLPRLSNSKAAGSSRGISLILQFFLCGWSALIQRSAPAKIVRVVKPKKSNFTRPIDSTSSLSNWLMTPASWSLASWVYRGQKSVNLPGAIRTPPACIPTFRVIPSNCCARANSCRTSSSFFSRSASCFSSFLADSMVTTWPGLKGTNLAIPSTKP